MEITISTTEEWVDIVDEDCQVIGSTSKKEAHEKGLLHKCVVSEIIDSKGRFILIKFAPQKQDPGQFVSPVGGHVRSGEDDLEALKREAFEETGLQDFKSRFVGKFIYNREVIGRKENHYFLIYEIYADDELILNEESVEYKRFTEKELKKELKTNPKKFGKPYHAIVDRLYPDLKI